MCKTRRHRLSMLLLSVVSKGRHPGETLAALAADIVLPPIMDAAVDVLRQRMLAIEISVTHGTLPHIGVIIVRIISNLYVAQEICV